MDLSLSGLFCCFNKALVMEVGLRALIFLSYIYDFY
jgi:hypothetical protein